MPHDQHREHRQDQGRRKAIYLALHPETGKTEGNSKARGLSDKMSFSHDTAAKTEKSRRTVERDTALGDALDDEVATADSPQSSTRTGRAELTRLSTVDSQNTRTGLDEAEHPVPPPRRSAA
jgi:hypothetical protein